MKKGFKILVAALAATMTMGFALVGGGCSLTDKVKKGVDQLFCKHEWDEGEVTKAATCGEMGVLTKTCVKCEKEKDESIKKIPHTALIQTESVNPTCTEVGYMTGTKCNDCGEWVVQAEEIPALGHSLATDKGYEATCTENGLTDGGTCTVCGLTVIEQEVIKALGHSMVVDKAVPATCESEGLTEGNHCERCKEVGIAQKVVAKLAHKYEDGVCLSCGGLDYDAFIAGGVTTKSVSGTLEKGKIYRIDLTHEEEQVGGEVLFSTHIRSTNGAIIFNWLEFLDGENKTVKAETVTVGGFFTVEGSDSMEYQFEFTGTVDVSDYFEVYFSEDGTYADVRLLKDIFEVEDIQIEDDSTGEAWEDYEEKFDYAFKFYPNHPAFEIYIVEVVAV